MAKRLCVCGKVLSNVLSPNETEGILLSDFDLEFDGAIHSWQIIDIGRSVWECDECGRLAIDYPAKDGITVKWYRPEDGTPGHLMSSDTESNDADAG